jgi:hypothetical protein
MIAGLPNIHKQRLRFFTEALFFFAVSILL